MEEVQEMLKELSKSIVDRFRFVINSQELYFEHEEPDVTGIPQDVLDLLIYSDLEFHTFDCNYYIVKEGKAVYEGVTDVQFAKDTIIKDIQTNSNFINLISATALEDELKVNDLLSDTDNVRKIYNQVMLEFKKSCVALNTHEYENHQG